MIFKPQVDLEFLDRVDALYREGYTQAAIASLEELSGAGALVGKLNRLGFDFERQGGLRVVTTLERRDYREMRQSGVLVALPAADEAETAAPVAA